MKTKEQVRRTISDSEILGRELTRKLCEQNGWDFYESVGEYTHYDCFIDIGDIHCIGEIKVRNVKFASKPTLHFEVKKYNELQDASDFEATDGILYINWLGNECYVFEITDELIENTEKGVSLSNKTTARSRLYEDKIEKEMYFLDKRKAKKYTLRNFENIRKRIIREHNLSM